MRTLAKTRLLFLKTEYDRAVAVSKAVGTRLRNAAQATENEREEYRDALVAERRALQAYTDALVNLVSLKESSGQIPIKKRRKTSQVRAIVQNAQVEQTR
jgi:hypothetical protein